MKKRQIERNLQFSMGGLLRWGVVVAASIVLFGGIIYLARHGLEHPSYRTFEYDNSLFHTFRTIVHGVVTFRGRAIIMLGILILVCTPIARILFAVLGFAREKDTLYVIIGLIVLGIIAFSLLTQTAAH